MGGMAASGGYWISSTADYIVADKNTITGSIGIFALFPTFENTIKKMGMSSDGVATTDLAETSALSPLNKNTQDISTLAEAANYSLKASNIALQDHATLVQHDAQIAENSRRISSVERERVRYFSIKPF